MMAEEIGKGLKTVSGMGHLGALPGTPLYDAAGGFHRLLDAAIADIEALQAAGIDAVMFGNENDRPYSLAAPAAQLAAMSAVVAAARPASRVPFGVNFLWAPVASVQIAAAT